MQSPLDPSLLLQLVVTSIEEASAKFPVSFRHDNDRLTARNLACALEHVSFIFAGSNRDDVALPSSFLRGERNKCLVFWMQQADRLKRPAIRARSFITSTLAIPQPFHDFLHTILQNHPLRSLLPQRGWFLYMS